MTTSNDPAGTALSCTGVVKHFGQVPVVTDMDFAAEPGECVALLGPSGCGKTTTLRLIAGFDPIDAGVITVGGTEVARALPGAPWLELPPERRRVGMVFQDYALFPHLNVRQNVEFGLRRGQRSHGAAALDLVGLSGFGDRMPGQLSGGQQQRVALARALAPAPAIVLLDEPFSQLDVALRASVRSEVRQILKQAGTTSILVTHDQEEALSIADRVAVMLAGRVVQIATPEELYGKPTNREVASFVGEAMFLPGTATGDRVSCLLGTVPVHEHRQGAVEVVVRPEAVIITEEAEGPEITDAADAAGAPGTVEDREYVGYSRVVRVALDAGPRLRARTDPQLGLRPGDRVRLALRGPVHVLPPAADGVS